MIPVSRITAFECNRRIVLLNRFILLFRDYLSEIRVRGSFDEPEQSELAEAYRTEINKISNEVSAAISASGQTPSLCWSPPPSIGGQTQLINVIYNVFKLRRYMIPSTAVTDIIECAIGIYEAEVKKAWFRTFNPIFWFFRLVGYIASFPFRFIEHIGLPRHKFESSLLGKLFKGVVEFCTGMLVILTFLQTSGLLEHIKQLLGLNK